MQKLQMQFLQRNSLSTVIDYGIYICPISQGIRLTERSRTDIHETSKWSAPSPGGLTRLSCTDEDKMVRDWFKEQVLALGAKYQVCGTH